MLKVGDKVKLVDDIQEDDVRCSTFINCVMINELEDGGIIDFIDDEDGIHSVQSKYRIKEGLSGWWIDENVLELVEGVDFKWTKKPIVVEAFQWTGDVNQLGEPEWIVEAMHQDLVNITYDDYGNPILLILTLEGEMMAKQGDYIIKGIKGELYPCDEEIFLASYER